MIHIDPELPAGVTVSAKHVVEGMRSVRLVAKDAIKGGRQRDVADFRALMSENVQRVVDSLLGGGADRVVDLMEVLKESLKETQSKKPVPAGARSRKAR